MLRSAVKHFISCGLIGSHQRRAAGSQPAGWAAGGSSAGRRGYSVGTGRRCPAAAPETGCCKTSLRSQTLCCPLVVGRRYCRQVSPSVSEELRGEREVRKREKGEINERVCKFVVRQTPRRLHV